MEKQQGARRDRADRSERCGASEGENRGEDAGEAEWKWQPGEPIKTVFLFGSGICAGSWDPVRQAILDVDPKAPIEVNTPSSDRERYAREVACANESANFWFADLVHARRRLETFLPLDEEQLRTRGLKQDYSEWRKVLLERREAFAKADRELKQAIVERLKEAVKAGRLTVRKEFWSRMTSDDRFDGSCLYLTTDWDTALEKAAEEEKGIDLRGVMHIHGSTGRPERLFLPSEVVEEPYRSPEERLELANSVYWWSAINSAEQVCLYGLSLSPADVELTQTLRMGFDNHKIGPGTVFIMNKEDQMDIISRRLRWLAPDWRIERIPV